MKRQGRHSQSFPTVLLFSLLLLSSSSPSPVEAQGGDPADADPRRVPPEVLWNVGVPGRDIAIGSDGNPVIVDQPDMRTTKVDGMTGAIIWNVMIDSGSSVDPRGVAVGPDNNPVLVGTIHSGDSNFRIVKLDGTTGAILWSVSFDGGNNEQVSGVAVGLDGNPVVTGTFNGNQGFLDMRTVKLNGVTGAVLWSVTFDGGFEDVADAIAITSDGNPIVSGATDDGMSYGPRIIKYDGATGGIIWNVFLANTVLENAEGFGIAIGSDGNPVITGDDGSGRCFAAKIGGMNGTILWNRSFEDSSSGLDVAIDSSGDPTVTGGSRTVKFDGATGEILWSLAGAGTVLSSGNGIAIGPDNRLVATGESTVKYGGPVNNIPWVARADNIVSDLTTQFVAIGADGNPVVTGTFLDVGEGFRTIKYDGVTGVVVWSADFGVGGDRPSGVAVGPDGNPVVGSHTQTEDFRIIKYNGATGAIVWNVTFANVGRSRAVAIGPDGNPVIVGTFAGTSDNDFRVIKLDAATGNLLWNNTFDSGAPDEVAGVAVGFDGNPVLAGTSGLPFTQSSDFRLIKYDGVTGSILWNVTFDGGTAFGDEASAVAVGPDCNPVVVGTVFFFSFSRAQTIKYDGATGQIIWNSVNPDTSLERLGGVAVGSDGNPIVTGIFAGGVVARLISYDGVTGSQLSATDFDTGDSEDIPTVAIGPDGNPVLAESAVLPIEGVNLWIIKYLTEVITPAGPNIPVSLNGGTVSTNGATVTFSQVTQSGETTFLMSAAGPALPAGFSIGNPPLFYDIHTTSTFTAPVTVCIAFDPARFSDQNNTRLLHFENNALADVTTSNDVINHIVCGQVNGFSLFSVAETLPPPPVVFNFTGFFQPVDNLPTLNSVNSGRAIPVKFSLDGFRGLDIFDLGYPKSQTIPCNSTDPVNGIEETVTAGASGLSYDATADRYVYVWKTDKAWANTCRQLVVKLKDGTFHRANFKLTK
jgi:outer membrane protein assembly factor BamB